MPEWSLVDRSHVLRALGEYDSLGDREFLRRYGFRRSVACTLWHRGREYDARAVLGVACMYATGTPATPAELSGRTDGVDVVVDEEAVAGERPRRSAPRTRRTGAGGSTAALKVCPTCHMALPASGVCDFCD
jgi:hypothetical protein